MSRSAAGVAATAFGVLVLFVGVVTIVTAPTALEFSSMTLGIGVIVVLVAIGLGVTLPGVFTGRRGWLDLATVLVAIVVFFDAPALIIATGNRSEHVTSAIVVTSALLILGIVTLVLLAVVMSRYSRSPSPPKPAPRL